MRRRLFKVDLYDAVYSSMFLSCEEMGAYWKLLLFYADQQKPLLDDNNSFCGITHLRMKTWLKIRPQVERLFIVRDGAWHHKDLDADIRRLKARASRSNVVSLEDQLKRQK